MLISLARGDRLGVQHALFLCVRPRRIGEFAGGWHAVDCHRAAARIGKALREVGNVMIGMALAATPERPRPAFVNKGLEGAPLLHGAARAKARMRRTRSTGSANIAAASAALHSAALSTIPLITTRMSLAIDAPPQLSEADPESANWEQGTTAAIE
jgi:hypothetical protein